MPAVTTVGASIAAALSGAGITLAAVGAFWKGLHPTVQRALVTALAIVAVVGLVAVATTIFSLRSGYDCGARRQSTACAGAWRVTLRAPGLALKPVALRPSDYVKYVLASAQTAALRRVARPRGGQGRDPA